MKGWFEAHADAALVGGAKITQEMPVNVVLLHNTVHMYTAQEEALVARAEERERERERYSDMKR